MKTFKDRVAVVTGAASGIGRGIAGRCAREGMNVVLADVETQTLDALESELKAAGAEATAVVTDVSDNEAVNALAQRTMETYNRVDLLFNNAGVAAGSCLWESSLNDCKWVLGVNLWGVIHCIRAFVPIMLGQNSPGHIVNTSSIAGVTTFHPSALYHLTKQSIVAISEQLHHDLAIRGAKINVSVLCPGFVNTRIMDAERNRPAAYQNPSAPGDGDGGPNDVELMFRQMIEAGMSPETVADIVFRAIAEEKFFIFTHPEMKPMIRARVQDLLDERNPVLPPMDGP